MAKEERKPLDVALKYRIKLWAASGLFLLFIFSMYFIRHAPQEIIVPPSTTNGSSFSDVAKNLSASTTNTTSTGVEATSSSGTTIKPTPPSLPPKPFMATLTSPAGSVTVERGKEITFRWETASGTGYAVPTYVTFRITPETVNEKHEQSFSFPFSAGKGTGTITVLPGSYVVTVPAIAEKALRYALPERVSVQVTPGVPARVSPSNSRLEFKDGTTSGKISGDGVCTATVIVSVNDQYRYPFPGAVVKLSSSRGSKDTITPQGSATNENGEIRFTVTSKTTGYATLTAGVNDVDIDTVSLQVLSKNATCPQ